jgi:hypothetical protein
VAVTLASLAYFTGDGVLVPAVPRYVQGPLAAGRPATFLASAAVAGAGLLMVVRRPGWK